MWSNWSICFRCGQDHTTHRTGNRVSRYKTISAYQQTRHGFYLLRWCSCAVLSTTDQWSHVFQSFEQLSRVTWKSYVIRPSVLYCNPKVRRILPSGIFPAQYEKTIWDIDIIRMCSWFWVKRCSWFCSIMFGSWVIYLYKSQKNLAFDGIEPHKISQQLYMLRQNRLYHSVQLNMTSLLIWIV